MANNKTIDGVPRELLERIAQWGSVSWPDKNELRALLAAPVVERQEPFMYGIMQPDGKPHYSELCVSGDASDLESEVDSMNDGEGLGYRVVPLFTLPPAPVAVESILVEAVAVTHECEENSLRLDWLLEGGIAALELPGTVLFVAHGTVTNDKGHGYVIPVEGGSDE